MRLRHLVAPLVLALGIAASGGAAQAANLLVDPNFDVQPMGLGGWTTSENLNYTQGSGTSSDPYLLTGSNVLASLSQNVATIAGQSYQFSLSLQNDVSSDYYKANASSATLFDSFSALFGSNTLVSISNKPSIDPTVYSGIFTATSASTTVALNVLNIPGYWVVRDISVAAVPLPAALPMFGAALAGLGGLGWRRRKAA